MALFNRDENKTQPLSSFESEPISGSADQVPLGGPILSPRLTPEVSQSDDKNSITRAAPAAVRVEPIDIDARLKSLARQIAGSKKKLVANVLEIGRALTDAQDLLADHAGGAFGKWVKQNCGFSKRTAYNYMSAHLVFGGCAIIAQRRFEPSTMYLLANDSTPSGAVTEAIQIAESGETVTSKTAKKLITKHSDGKPARKVSSRPGRPQPIQLIDAQAVVTIRPLSEGVDICSLLGRLLKEQLDLKRKEAA